jgi:hypothetical protein
MFDLLYAWPGELPGLAQCLSVVHKAAVLLRLQRFHDAEAEILAALGVQATDASADLLTLRALCAIEMRQFDGAAAAVEALVQLGDCCPDEQRRWIQARYWMKTGQFALLQQQTDTFWQCQICWPLALNHVDWLVGLGELDHATRILDALPAPFHQCLEALLFRASILERCHASTLSIPRPHAPEIKQIVGRPVGRVAHAGQHLQVLERGLALLDHKDGGARRDEGKAEQNDDGGHNAEHRVDVAALAKRGRKH